MCALCRMFLKKAAFFSLLEAKKREESMRLNFSKLWNFFGIWIFKPSKRKKTGINNPKKDLWTALPSCQQ